MLSCKRRHTNQAPLVVALFISLCEFVVSACKQAPHLLRVLVKVDLDVSANSRAELLSKMFELSECGHSG